MIRTLKHSIVPVLWVILLTLIVASIAMGQTVGYEGTLGCNDPEDGVLIPTWVSDIQGDLGSGSPAIFSLNIGTHTITATCTDSGGLAVSDSIVVDVSMPNQPPVITDPIDVQPSAVAVIPEAAIGGTLYGIRIEPRAGEHGPASLDKVDGDEHVADWGGRLRSSFMVRLTGATFEDGVEVVIIRGVDVELLPAFDLVVTGTTTDPTAHARVFTADMQYHDTSSYALTEEVHEVGVEWYSDSVDGGVRLWVDGRGRADIFGLNTVRDLYEMQLGLPVSTVGFEGYLDIDDAEFERI